MAGEALYDVIFGAATLRQCTNVRVEERPNVVRDRISGNYATSQVSVIDSQPMVSLTTQDIKTSLANLTLAGGLSVAAGTITIPFQQRSAGGLFAGGSNNNTVAATHGVAVITELSGRQGDAGGVTANVEIHLLSSDGTTHPYTINTNQSLAASAFTGSYSMGPVTLDPTGVGVLAEVDRITAWTVSPSNNVTRYLYGADDFPTELDVTEVNPTASFTFADLDTAQSFATTIEDFAAINLWAKARAANGRHTANASAAHIKIAFADGVKILEVIEGSDRGRVTGTVRIEAATVPTITTDTAIVLA